MPTNYTTWSTQLLNAVAAYSSDPNWTTALPQIIDYAEQRIYRDLDLLATRVTDQSAVVTPLTRNFSLPTSVGTFIGLDGINILTPSTATSSNAARNPVYPVSRAMMDATWPNASSFNGVPQMFAWADNATIIFGPAPDLAYPVEVVGWQRPAPLSATNSSTPITQLLPDLWFACTMVGAAAFMRDFGSQADNPAMAQSWEGQYKALLMSADIEEARKQFRSQGWTSQQPRIVSSPPRT